MLEYLMSCHLVILFPPNNMKDILPYTLQLYLHLYNLLKKSNFTPFVKISTFRVHPTQHFNTFFFWKTLIFLVSYLSSENSY